MFNVCIVYVLYYYEIQTKYEHAIEMMWILHISRLATTNSFALEFIPMQGV